MTAPMTPTCRRMGAQIIGTTRVNEFIEITEDEANQIVERIRATVTGANNG